MMEPSLRRSASEAPILKILALLAATIGLPYFLLSSTEADRELGLHPRRHFALRVDDLEEIHCADLGSVKMGHSRPSASAA